MALESATYIPQLVPSNPAATDPVGQGYEHLTMLKQVLLTTFPNLTAPVTATPAQLNSIVTTSGGQTVAGTTTLAAASVTGVLSAGSVSISGAATVGSTLSVSTSFSAATGAVSGSLTAGSVGITAGLTAASAAISGALSAGSITLAGNPIFMRGMIMMWSGAIGSIPGGWLICDGTNGTPDLRGQFVIGAGGSYAIGAVGGSANVTLVTANLPSHIHGVTDPGHNHTLTDPKHAHSVSDPGHLHSIQTPVGVGVSAGGYSSNSGPNAGVIDTDPAVTGVSIYTAATGITMAATTTGITIQATGSGTAFSILPPYYALAFIMKS